MSDQQNLDRYDGSDEAAESPALVQERDRRMAAEAHALLLEQPELHDESMQEQALQAAQEAAAGLGLPELARDPSFIGKIWREGEPARQDAAFKEGLVNRSGGRNALPF